MLFQPPNKQTIIDQETICFHLAQKISGLNKKTEQYWTLSQILSDLIVQMNSTTYDFLNPKANLLK